ncbi:MAG: hypothetical protein JWM09_1282 [Francisellaceae bacterium]|nr:hypothetical protein [Francisellaceae bacterium]
MKIYFKVLGLIGFTLFLSACAKPSSPQHMTIAHSDITISLQKNSPLQNNIAIDSV